MGNLSATEKRLILIHERLPRMPVITALELVERLQDKSDEYFKAIIDEVQLEAEKLHLQETCKSEKMRSYWVTISGMVETQEDYYIEEAKSAEDAAFLACERADDDGLDDVQVVRLKEIKK